MKMKLVFFYFFNLLIITSSWNNVNSQKVSSFSKIKNYDIDPKISTKWLIVKFKASTDITCQTTCNLNSLCLNFFYNTADGTCSLYSKIFPLNQFIESINTDFYIKNSNFKVNNYINYKDFKHLMSYRSYRIKKSNNL